MGLVVWTCNPSIQEVEPGRLIVWCQSSLHSETLFHYNSNGAKISDNDNNNNNNNNSNPSNVQRYWIQVGSKQEHTFEQV